MCRTRGLDDDKGMEDSLALRLKEIFQLLSDHGVDIEETPAQLRKRIGREKYKGSAQRFNVNGQLVTLWATIIPKRLLPPEKMALIEAGKL